MTDITELAQSLKAAAEKATPGEWCAYCNTKTGTFAIHTPDDSRYGNIIDWMGFDGVDMPKTQKSRNAKFIALANPANILALVEALEKAQRYIEELREWNAGLARESFERQQRIAELEVQRELAFAASNRWADKFSEAERRIAELESRTVTVKLPRPGFITISGERTAVYLKDDVDAVLTAAGIKVEAE